MISILGIISIFSVSCSETDSTANTAAEANAEAPLYPDATTALTEGNKFFDENNVEKAIEAFKFATKLNPDLAEAHFKLGLAYALLESEQELIVTPVEGTNSIAEEPSEKGKKPKEEKKSNSVLAFENAVTAFKKILKENPKDAVSHFNLGRVYERLNNDEDSRKSLEEAVKLSEDDSQYRTELGRVLVKLAQYDEAIRSLKKALEIDETNGQALELMDDATAGKKRVDFGVDAMTKTLKTGKDSNKSNKSDNQADSNTAGTKESDNSNKKEPEKKKETPKAPATQPKKPASSNLE